MTLIAVHSRTTSVIRGKLVGWDDAGFYPPSGLCKSSNQRWPVQKADITHMPLKWNEHEVTSLINSGSKEGVRRERRGESGQDIMGVKQGLTAAHFTPFYAFTSHLAPERWWISSGWWSAHQWFSLSLTWGMTHEGGISSAHPISDLREDSHPHRRPSQ